MKKRDFARTGFFFFLGNHLQYLISTLKYVNKTKTSLQHLLNEEYFKCGHGTATNEKKCYQGDYGECLLLHGEHIQAAVGLGDRPEFFWKKKRRIGEARGFKKKRIGRG